MCLLQEEELKEPASIKISGTYIYAVWGRTVGSSMLFLFPLFLKSFINSMGHWVKTLMQWQRFRPQILLAKSTVSVSQMHTHYTHKDALGNWIFAVHSKMKELLLQLHRHWEKMYCCKKRRPDTSRRVRRPPCPLVIALVPLKCSSRN